MGTEVQFLWKHTLGQDRTRNLTHHTATTLKHVNHSATSICECFQVIISIIQVFFPRISKDWNNLSDDIVTIDNLDTLKKSVTSKRY